MVAYEALLLRNCGQIPQCDGTNERSGQELSSASLSSDLPILCPQLRERAGARSNAVYDHQALMQLATPSAKHRFARI